MSHVACGGTLSDQPVLGVSLRKSYSGICPLHLYQPAELPLGKFKIKQLHKHVPQTGPASVNNQSPKTCVSSLNLTHSNVERSK